MKLCYQPLFQVQLRHTFYRQGESVSDFQVCPTSDTKAFLEERGLRFRFEPGRFSVYAEIIPDSDPAMLMRSIGSENVTMRFMLKPLHPYLFNISQFDDYFMGREVFCFDNLRNDQADGRRYLGDTIAGSRLGEPVSLQTAEILDYQFSLPVASAQLTLFNRFDKQIDTVLVTAPQGVSTIDRYRYDLSKVSAMTPGRYRLVDNHGGETTFFYDPNQFGENVFGMIELFNRTDQLTPDVSNRVPNDYRYLIGDELVPQQQFSLQIERRATRWRYTVIKKYDNNPISLAQLSITGPVVFSGVNGSQQVVFTANDPLPLAESQQDILLLHDGSEIRSLPNPSPSSPVDGTTAEGIKYSDMYVYV